VSSKNIIAIAMSFVGLLVGAGFATGQEVVQYFTAFGTWGIPGIIIAALIMTLAGTVFLQLGSYFHASEHNTVFRNVTHPIVSKLLDVAVIITLFAIGFVMLAGAGSNMQQQFGWKTWIGSTLVLVLVLIVGMLDVDKVSKVIGAVTPTIIIAVIGVAIYTGLNMPDDIGAAMDASSQIDTPIGNWLISALNYNGLALMLAVSMSLVIGGDNDARNTPGTKGSEVLHHLLSRGKACADQQAHEGHCNGDNVFRRHSCLTFVANISRILVRAAPLSPAPQHVGYATPICVP